MDADASPESVAVTDDDASPASAAATDAAASPALSNTSAVMTTRYTQAGGLSRVPSVFGPGSQIFAHRSGRPRRPEVLPRVLWQNNAIRFTNPPALQTQQARPDIPAQTVDQQRMLMALDRRGHYGLSACIKTIAKERSVAQAHASWDLVVGASQEEVLQILYGLPVYILRPLIANTLSYEMQHGSNSAHIALFVSNHMNKSMKVAGVYANILSIDSKQTTIATTNANAMPTHNDGGKWLNAVQVGRMCTMLEDHIDGRAVIPGMKSFSSNVAREFIARTRHLYVAGVGPADQNKPFLRVPMVVGETQEMLRRLLAHERRQSNALFNHVLKYTDTQPVPPMRLLQVVLAPIWQSYSKLMSIAEITMSILCSSYWDSAGFNPARAGGCQDKYDSLSEWNNDADEAYLNRDHVLPSLRTDWKRELARKELYEGALTAFQDEKDIVQRRETRLNSGKQRLLEWQEECQTGKDEVEEVQIELKAQKRDKHVDSSLQRFRKAYENIR